MQRTYPKGIKEVKYPSEDIILRFTSKDYTGEIRLNNETNEFHFDPPLNIGANTQVSDIGLYSPELAYTSGNTYVYYSNDISPDAQFNILSIYRCVEDAEVGQNPELFPEKWILQEGDTSTTVGIDDIQDLRTELNNRVKFLDFGNQFNVTSDKEVALNIKYITVSNYMPSEDVPPVALQSGIIPSVTALSILEGTYIENAISFVLQSAPVDAIVIRFESSDPFRVNSNISSLRFTPSNWNIPQYIDLNALNIDGDGNNDNVILTVSVDESADTNYNAIIDFEISITVIDSGVAEIIPSYTYKEVTGGTLTTLSLTLSKQPASTVNLQWVSSNNNLVELSGPLYISPANWNIPSVYNVITRTDLDLIDEEVTITFSVGPYSDPEFENATSDIVYLVKEPIIPEEVVIGTKTWKTANTATNGVGYDLGYVYGGNDPNTNPDYAYNLNEYGRLYRVSDLGTVLTANPGYRLPTLNDMRELLEASYGTYTETSTQIYRSFNTQAPLASNITVWKDLTGVEVNTSLFNLPILWIGGVYLANGLYLVPGGKYYNTLSVGNYYDKQNSGYYWYEYEPGKYGLFTIVCNYFILTSASNGLPAGTRVGEIRINVSKSYYNPALSEYNATLRASVRLIKDI